MIQIDQVKFQNYIIYKQQRTMSRDSRGQQQMQRQIQSQQQSMFAVKIQKKASFAAKTKLIKINKKKNHFKWGKDQICLYLLFLRQFYDLFFLTYTQKQKVKIYTKMQDFIVTKDYRECRMYHYKKLQFYSSIDNIIVGMERLLYDRYLLKYCNGRYVEAQVSEAQSSINQLMDENAYLDELIGNTSQQKNQNLSNGSQSLD